MRPINADELLNDIEDAIDIENDGQDVEKSKLIILGLKIAKKYIKKARTIEAEPVNGWISVKDKLPEPYENVLVFGNFNGIATYRVDYLDDYGRWFRTFYVTHWRIFA